MFLKKINIILILILIILMFGCMYFIVYFLPEDVNYW